MGHIKLDCANLKNIISEADIAGKQEAVDRLHAELEEGTGPGNDFLGWLHLPSRTSARQTQEVKQAAAYIRDNCEAFVCVGIGGNDLGDRVEARDLASTEKSQARLHVSRGKRWSASASAVHILAPAPLLRFRGIRFLTRFPPPSGAAPKFILPGIISVPTISPICLT